MIMPTGRTLIDPYKALEEAGIRQDMKVADLGVGAVGHFLFPAAQMVGERGMVFGVDILQSVIQANRSRAKTAGVDNVEMIWGDIERDAGTRLPDNSIDLAIMVNVLYAVKKESALLEVKRILHTGGILCVIEWKPAGTVLGPPPEKRLQKEEAVNWAARAGLTFRKEFEAGPHHYGLVFTKPA